MAARAPLPPPRHVIPAKAGIYWAREVMQGSPAGEGGRTGNRSAARRLDSCLRGNDCRLRRAPKLDGGRVCDNAGMATLADLSETTLLERIESRVRVAGADRTPSSCVAVGVGDDAMGWERLR